jgi:hypothetical protein
MEILGGMCENVQGGYSLRNSDFAIIVEGCSGAGAIGFVGAKTSD